MIGSMMGDTLAAEGAIGLPGKALGRVGYEVGSQAARVGYAVAQAALPTTSISLNSSAAQYQQVAPKASPGPRPTSFVQGPQGPSSAGPFGLSTVAVEIGAAVVGLGVLAAIAYKLKKKR